MLAAVMSLAGCRHGPYAPRGYGPGQASYEHTERIIFADRSLVRDLKVVTLDGRKEPDGRYKAYAELENQTARNLPVLVQAQFRDASGRLTQDATNWRTIVMPPNSVTSYEAISMNDEAVDFVIRVMLARRH